MADQKKPVVTEEETTAPVADNNPHGVMGPDYWQNLLKQVSEKSGGIWFFPPDGRTRLRLLWRPGEPTFYAETRRYFRGKARGRYIILALTPDAEDENAKTKVRPVVVTKDVLQQILNYQVEGYDLLSEKGGHGITIVRSGSGLDTNYNVIAAQKTVAVSFSKLQWPEESLAGLATTFEEDSKSRDQNRVEEGAVEEAAASIRNQKGGPTAASMAEEW